MGLPMATITTEKTTAKPAMRRVAKKKVPDAVETSLSIEEQTAAFLKKGGNIQEINTGVSGQVGIAGPKHISLGNR